MKSNIKAITIIILLIVSALNLSFATIRDGDERVIREKSFNIAAGKKILLNTSSGDIQITPWNKAEVYVKVLGNKNAEEKFNFSFNATSEEVTIEAERKSGWNWFSNINLKFEIKVPSSFNVYANTSGGDIKVAGVNGDIKLKTSGGDIWDDRFEGNFSARTSGGDINLFCNNAKIDANTSGGDIELEYTGINQGIELKTSGGDIDIKLPADFNAKAELKTSGGEVDCNLTLNEVKKLSETKIDADINKGGNPLVAITSGGDITVLKK
ncbi:MAG: DUF4097 family beta strand repeat-containing protein [Ignavibacteriaceae bacterium]